MKLPSINNVSSGAMIVASAVLVWATMDRPAVLPIRPPDLYAVGDRFGEVPGYDFARSPTTLVLFVRSGCRFCTESMDFYRRLAAQPHRVPIIALSYDAQDKLTQYFAEHKLRVDGVLSVASGSLRIASTPALFLVSSSRRVERVWRGKLRSITEENAVLGAAVRKAE